ncbi:MAG: hypothetical protein GY832_11625 [Chloroflexi bacterium]|nr:hypothetical protein [Chloroflexota bacterium]
MLPLLEEAYLLGIKITKKLVEYKLSMPEWTENNPETATLRQLRVSLMEQMEEVKGDE